MRKFIDIINVSEEPLEEANWGHAMIPAAMAVAGASSMYATQPPHSHHVGHKSAAPVAQKTLPGVHVRQQNGWTVLSFADLGPTGSEHVEVNGIPYTISLTDQPADSVTVAQQGIKTAQQGGYTHIGWRGDLEYDLTVSVGGHNYSISAD